ncbi:YdbL family protein [Desulfolithobacter sp.]
MKHLSEYLIWSRHADLFRLLAVLTVLLTLLLQVQAGPVAALDLQSAKDQGLVGETPSGYLEVVGTATPEIVKLVQTINQKRRSRYLQIARKNGTDLAVVEKLAGKKAIEKTRPGNYIKVNGKWRKK